MWFADFICSVDFDCYRHGAPLNPSVYASFYGVTVKTIRRLLKVRENAFPSFSQEEREKASDSDDVAESRELSGNGAGTERAYILEKEQETETEEKKKSAPAALPPRSRKTKIATMIPDTWPTAADRDRIDRWNAKRRDPYPLPEIERRLEAFRLKCESNGTVGANFTSRFMDYCNRGFLEPPAVQGESPAQARVRRSLEAGAEAARILEQAQATGQSTLMLLSGGRNGTQ